MEVNTEFNFTRIIGVIIVIAILIWVSPIHGMIFPPPKVINQTKLIYINTTTTVLVTPTPDGMTYWASEYQNGIRKLGNPYSYIDYNTSDGVSDNPFKFTVNVYDWREFKYLHWFNPQDYKYYTLLPANGNKFVFIFVDMYIDDIISDNIRLWLPQSHLFTLQYRAQLYTEYPVENTEEPEVSIKQYRFRELEEIPTLNNEDYIQYYGQRRQYEEGYTHTAGEFSNKLYYLYEGKSNRVNGYIMYEIPDVAKIEDLTCNLNMGNFGKASWKLSGFN